LVEGAVIKRFDMLQVRAFVEFQQRLYAVLKPQNSQKRVMQMLGIQYMHLVNPIKTPFYSYPWQFKHCHGALA
jgi:hypothetical protein